jgi:septal ring factor EnvC (AmiA/AmiB activator)
VNATDIFAPIMSGIFSATTAGAVVAYFKDRRVAKAKGTVAEQTVDVEIDNNRLALLERQMLALSDSHNRQMEALAKSFDRERRSLLDTIDHVKQDLLAEQEESAKKDEKIARLTTQVNEIQDALDQVKAELAGKPPKPDSGS